MPRKHNTARIAVQGAVCAAGYRQSKIIFRLEGRDCTIETQTRDGQRHQHFLVERRFQRIKRHKKYNHVFVNKKNKNKYLVHVMVDRKDTKQQNPCCCTHLPLLSSCCVLCPPPPSFHDGTLQSLLSLSRRVHPILAHTRLACLSHANPKVAHTYVLLTPCASCHTPYRVATFNTVSLSHAPLGIIFPTVNTIQPRSSTPRFTAVREIFLTVKFASSNLGELSFFLIS